MYCRKCYAKLDEAAEFPRCLRCAYAFNPADPKTYLTRPFPGTWRIIGYIVATTIVSILGAFVVAFFEMAGASGH